MIKPVLAVCIFAGMLTGCSTSERDETQTIFGYSMGTSYSIKLVSSLNEARGLQLGVEGILSDINSRMSTYLPHSDLSKFKSSPVDTPINVDKKTALVVGRALEIAAATQGDFDPTIAPLVDLWGFGPSAKNATLPDDVQISTLLLATGYEAVSLLSAEVLKKSAPRELDLSAIAKGYAVDLVAQYLSDKGIDNFLVEIGGEMRFSGNKPDGVPWRIAIERPDVHKRDVYRVLEVSEGSIATSGDYRNFFEIDGDRYSHTIDPSTGYPVKHALASVTVVMENCMDADAYATAFMVMGQKKAYDFATEHNIAVMFIFKDKNEFLSKQSQAFTELFGVFEL